MKALNLAWSTECFNTVLNLFKQKWEQSNDENARKVVFENYLSFWCRNEENPTLINHFRGACVGHVTDNNGLEATNNVLKREYTLRELMPLLQFFHIVFKFVCDESKRLIPSGTNIKNYKKFAEIPDLQTKDMTRAYNYSKNSSKVVKEVNTQEFITIFGELTGEITNNTYKELYRIYKTHGWQTFDAYKAFIGNIAVITKKPDEFHFCICYYNKKTFS